MRYSVRMRGRSPRLRQARAHPRPANARRRDERFRGKVDIGAWNAVFRQVTERSCLMAAQDA